MKKLLVILALFTVLIACENQKNDFPDFDYTAAYFPYQYPVRTLVLGDYTYDNSNDNAHKFLISAGFGGVYQNKKDRVIDVELFESLCDSVLFKSTRDTIRVLPPSYYTLSSPDKIVIPEGKFNGSIEVQLADAFFNDTMAYRYCYVLPMRIVGSTDVDSILRGKTTRTLPSDPRNTIHWAVVPKDFTMFAIKFMNAYHGKYLHRGTSIVRDAVIALDTTVYRQKYNVDDEIWTLVTTGKNQVSVKGNVKNSEAQMSGAFTMLLNFADNGNCIVVQAKGSPFTITGTGKFSSGTETWGGKKRDAIYLNYSFLKGVYTYNATDTLVIRDRDVRLETFTTTIFDMRFND